ncbi:protein TolR [Natronospirillum operosum]|uniref:Tol-Pal system protein TolR n=1 Tax=Natronospirillum operosum TaxID=2759953 RepID=A0A4Z0WBK8_9GAMM|nr:protein TolR [Natronospirillum operosum]TGG93925.1 protein TolR [Natronospirillum operosum]
MRNKGNRRRPMAEINVVPYIDVMLVLLVIFMVTAPMLTQGVDVELPRVSTEPLPTEDDRENLIVSVTADQEYYLELGEESPQSVPLTEIQTFVRQILENNPGTAVLVRGDQSVPYGRVVELMVMLQQSGVHNVGLVTEPL